MGAHFKLDRQHRAAIEDRIESLIALLDGWDGDWDVEEDDPPGCDLEQRGEASSDDGRPLMQVPPNYALDQSAGPLNVREAAEEHRAKELGLVRGAGGGWRYPARK